MEEIIGFRMNHFTKALLDWRYTIMRSILITVLVILEGDTAIGSPDQAFRNICISLMLFQIILFAIDYLVLNSNENQMRDVWGYVAGFVVGAILFIALRRFIFAFTLEGTLITWGWYTGVRVLCLLIQDMFFNRPKGGR